MAQLTPDAFNRLGQYSRMVLVTGLLRTRRFYPEMVMTIASIHVAYPRMDGQLSWRQWSIKIITRWCERDFEHANYAATHPSTNRARRKATLMETNALALCQAAT